MATLLLVAPGSARAQAVLKPVGAVPVMFDFGLSRSAQTRTIVFTVTGTHAADNPLAGLATELTPGTKPVPPKNARQADDSEAGSFVPASAISVGQVASTEPTLVSLSVKVDPTGVSHGTYHGTLYLVGKDIKPYKLAVEARLGRREHNSVYFAALAIFIGVLVGAALKWLTGAAATVRTLNHRYLDLTVQIDKGLQHWAPPNALGALDQARRYIGYRDFDNATKTLDQITQQFAAYAPLVSRLQDLAATLTMQENRINDLPAVDQQSLTSAAQALGVRLDELRNSLWAQPGDPTDHDALQANLGAFAALISALDNSAIRAAALALIPNLEASDWPGLEKGLAALAPPPPPPPAPAPGRAPAGLLARVPGLGPVASWRPAVLASARGWASGALASLGTSTARAWHVLRAWTIEYSGFCAGCIVGLVITVIGLEALYTGGDTFGSWQDWLKLGGWGFGAQVTGVTVTQLGSHFSSSGPTI